MDAEFKEAVADAVHLLARLRHPDIDEKNCRRCNLIDLYLDRGGKMGGWLSPNELTELLILQKECQEWLHQNGFPDLRFKGMTDIPIGPPTPH